MSDELAQEFRRESEKRQAEAHISQLEKENIEYQRRWNDQCIVLRKTIEERDRLRLELKHSKQMLQDYAKTSGIGKILFCLLTWLDALRGGDRNG